MTLEQLYRFKLVRMLLGGTWVKRDGVWQQAWAFHTDSEGKAYYMVHRGDLSYEGFHCTNSSIEAKEIW